MWIRNLMVFGLAGDHALTADGIAEALANKKFIPAGMMDLGSIGWVAPAKHRPDYLAIEQQDAVLICLRVESKLLPPAVINQEADRRAEKIEAEENRKVGRRELREMRERITQELIGRAFSTQSHQRAVIDLKNNRVLIEASSANKAEAFLTHLREAIGNIPARLLATKYTPRGTMTAWLQDSAPENFTLDADCKLESPGDGGAVATFSRQNLGADEVRAHLATGMQVGKIGLSWADKISFMVTEKLEFKKLAMLNLLTEQNEQDLQSAEDQAALFDTSFALFIGSMRQFLPAVLDAFGGETGDLFDAEQKPEATTTSHEPQGVLPWAANDADPLYPDAVEYVRKNRKASISAVQRFFNIGYNRAACLIERMENLGVVTPAANDGSREVRVA